jgi:V8-like Glu-specific endopeptidase
MQFDGPTRGELRKALEAALTPGTVPMMMAERMNRQWANIVPPAATFSEQMFVLLQTANAEGWIEQLLIKAREFNPGNPQLAAVAMQIGLSLTGVNYEQTVRNGNAFLDLSTWRAKLGRIEFQVCRMEVPTDQTDTCYGTGFLVGPNCVLTNHHVVEAVIAGENGSTTQDGLSAKAANVRCRFDYKELEGEVVNKGTVYRLAPNWLADFSQPEPPGPQKLDYALLRLERAVGDEPISTAPGNGGEKRGFIKIPSTAYLFPGGSPLVIVQHPERGPLKIAFDTDSVVSIAGDRSRVKYNTNAENGSSGSPCFTQRLDAVALHQGKVPGNGSKMNIGMPLDAIRQLMAQRGTEQEIG